MIKMKKLLKEGILDGITASFAIDAGITTSTVKSGRKSLTLPRYSVWGFKSNSTIPKLMENTTLVETIFEKYDFTEDDIFPIDGTIKETLKKITESKFPGDGDGDDDVKKTTISNIKSMKVLS